MVFSEYIANELDNTRADYDDYVKVLRLILNHTVNNNTSRFDSAIYIFWHLSYQLDKLLNMRDNTPRWRFCKYRELDKLCLRRYLMMQEARLIMHEEAAFNYDY